MQGATQTMTRQRIEPTPKQVAALRLLIEGVPTIVTRDWQSEEGLRCLRAIADAQARGVPLTWLAEALSLDVGPLYQAIRKHIKTKEDA
jgi:hypothetical protein